MDKVRYCTAHLEDEFLHTMKARKITTRVLTYSSVAELPEDMQQLMLAAQDAMHYTHSPYSHFPVGAALLTADGAVIKGSNQENASFPLGLCAERIALANFAMVKEQGKKVTAIAVSVNGAVAAPCGMCRQALLEQEHKQENPIRVFLKGTADEVLEVDSIEALLPLPFFSKNLMK